MIPIYDNIINITDLNFSKLKIDFELVKSLIDLENVKNLNMQNKNAYVFLNLMNNID